MSSSPTLGIMEWWNNGMLISKERYSFINFTVKRSFVNIPISHSPKTHYSIVPVFQYSNCERSELSSYYWSIGVLLLVCMFHFSISFFGGMYGGERGIRTPGTTFGSTRDFQSRSLGQLGHLSIISLRRNTFGL